MKIKEDQFKGVWPQNQRDEICEVEPILLS